MNCRIVRRQPIQAQESGESPVSISALPENMHPVLRRIMLNRQVRDAGELETGLDGLARPELMGGMDDAVALISRWIRDQGRILIVGDFDADGATSTCLAITALKAMGAHWVHYLVPNRFEYGYGLSPELVVEAVRFRPDLIITVDNGISSHHGVRAARTAGIDVLVTDHHLPGATLPNANAIINPNLNGDSFPSKNLAGVGVVFYLMLALRGHLRDEGWFEANELKAPNLADSLDLVALGTVADVVPLDRNNRILVEQGLRRIRAGRVRPGIQALLEVAGRDPAQVKSSDMGFAIGPRLNAAGRLDDMSEGIECLLSREEADAKRRAIRLDQLNRERREIETGMRAEAIAVVETLQIDPQGLPLGLCLYEENWHEGVVGIVASRVKEEIHRPVIAFARSNDGALKGSARSVSGVHIRDVLERIHALKPGLILKFGGHAMAAGLTLAEQNYETFKLAFETAVAEVLDPNATEGVVYSDGELRAGEMTLELARQLAFVQPWGQGFPEPVFDGEFEVVSRKTIGDGSHLKMMLRPLDGQSPVEAVAFNYRDEIPRQGEHLRVAFQLDVNHFRGEERLQCLIRHAERG